MSGVQGQVSLIKEFQRLQEAEQKQLGWDVKRNLTMIKWFINEGLEQPERLKKLNRIAIEQMQILTSDHNLKRLEEGG